MRGPAGGVRAAEPRSPRGAVGGRAPLGLELRLWEGSPHSPPAPGGGDEHLHPPPARGEGHPDPRFAPSPAGCCRAFLSSRSAHRWACCSRPSSAKPVSYVTWTEDRPCDRREGDWDLNAGCGRPLAGHGGDSESLSLKCVYRPPLARSPR